MLKSPEITDLLETWDVGNVAGSGPEDEGVLDRIFEVMESVDGALKIKALKVLIEIARQSGRRIRKRILEMGLSEIIEAIRSDDDRISGEALKLLEILLKDNTLTDRKLTLVFEAMLEKSSSGNPFVWEGIMGVVENVKPPYIFTKSTEFLLDVLRGGSAEGVAVASLILVKWGCLSREEWRLLVEKIADLVDSGTERLIDIGLKSAAILVELPPVFPMDSVVKRLLPALRRLVFSNRDRILRAKALDALDGLREMVIRYYRLHPCEAQKTAEELLDLGLVDEAYLITSTLISLLPADSTYRRETTT